MLIEAFLGGLVVVGHHLQGGLGPQAMGLSGEFDGLSGGIGPRARNDRNATRSLLHGHLYELQVFVDIHRGRLARRAHGHNAMRAAGHMPIDQGPKGSQIKASIGLHRGHDGNQAADDGVHETRTPCRL